LLKKKRCNTLVIHFKRESLQSRLMKITTILGLNLRDRRQGLLDSIKASLIQHTSIRLPSSRVPIRYSSLRVSMISRCLLNNKSFKNRVSKQRVTMMITLSFQLNQRNPLLKLQEQEEFLQLLLQCHSTIIKTFPLSQIGSIISRALVLFQNLRDLVHLDNLCVVFSLQELKIDKETRI
jgi:hypothetical protein